MPSRTYVAQRLGAFAGLLKASNLAGYRLEPHPPFSVRDRYFDTDDGELLRRGVCLRVREREGDRRALIRPVRPGDEGPAVEVALESADQLEALEPLREVLIRLTGAPEPPVLHPLLSLRQYRTPRAAYDGNRLIGLLSFDVVVYELPDGPHASNELDVELADSGTQLDLNALDPILRAEGLEAVARTKMERGIERLPRRLTEPLLLLPHEREALEEFIASGDALHQRRARVLLLDARGFKSATIANQLGLSTARVRHWKQLFREQRLEVFEGAATRASAVPAYTVSELVTESPDGPFSSLPPAPSDEPLVDSFAEEADSSEIAEEPPPNPSSGDGATGRPDLSAMAGDLDDLLDLFQPGATNTPLLLDDEPDAPASAHAPDAPESGEERAEVTTEPDALPVDPRAPVETTSLETQDERATGFLSLTTPEADATEADAPGPPARPDIRRPRLHPDDPLAAAAHDVLAYHVSQLGWCAADLDRDRGPYRLYLAVHRVRLALEVFAPILPGETVSRLHAGLRRLAVGLSRTLELEREESPTAADRRQQALGAVRELLEGRMFASWIDRASRLVDRLAAQREAGSATPDDAPLPWDDYIDEPTDQPTRSRLRHLLGTALWSRVEAVLVWERDGEAPSRDDAYALALACSGIRFVLGLAERVAPEPVRRADALLESAEADLVRVHRGKRDHLHDAWTRIRSDELRGSLSDVLRLL
ncbi:MAG: CYTH domain-containing protein [Bacteroidota bacterium]